MINQFLIGPHIVPNQPFVEVFAPYVWLKTKDGNLTKFQMFVYLGFKTLFALFLKLETHLTSEKLRDLNAYLSKQVGILSQQLDSQVSRPQAQSDTDQVRFFYFSKMNLAIKIDGLLSKDVLTLDLKHILNQMHQQFQEDPENCLEQTMNTGFYWVAGINSLGREVYLIFPPNYSSSRVEQEKSKILKTYF